MDDIQLQEQIRVKICMCLERIWLIVRNSSSHSISFQSLGEKLRVDLWSLVHSCVSEGLARISA